MYGRARVLSETTYQAHYSVDTSLARSRSQSFKHSTASSLDDHPDFALPHSRGTSPNLSVRALCTASPNMGVRGVSPNMGVRAVSPISYSRGGPGYDMRPRSRQSSKQGSAQGSPQRSPQGSPQGSPCYYSDSDMIRPYIDPLTRPRSLSRPPRHTPLEPSISYSDSDLLYDRNIKPSELNAVYADIKSLQPPPTHINCKVTSDTDLLNNQEMNPLVMTALYNKMIALQKPNVHNKETCPRTRRTRAKSEPRSCSASGRRVSVHFSKALGQMGLYIDGNSKGENESIQIEYSSTPPNPNLSTPPVAKFIKKVGDNTKSRPHSIPPLQSSKRAVSFDAFKDLLITNANKNMDKMALKAKSTNNAKAKQAESSSADSSGTDTPVYLQRAQSLKHIGNSSHSDEKFFSFTDEKPTTLTEKIKKKLERSKVLSDVKSRSQTRLKANTSSGMVTVVKDNEPPEYLTRSSEYLTKSSPGRSDLTIKSPDPYKGNLYTYNNDNIVDLHVTPVFMRRSKNKQKNKKSLF